MVGLLLMRRKYPIKLLNDSVLDTFNINTYPYMYQIIDIKGRSVKESVNKFSENSYFDGRICQGRGDGFLYSFP